MQHRTDVLIVGARVAGSVLAARPGDALAEVLWGGDEAEAWSRFHARRDDHALED